MGALDFLSEVWAGGGTIIILELSSRSTFLLCFIHSWSPVKLWIRAVKSLALLEGMERRVKAGKPLSLRDLSLALGFRSGWLSSVVERVNLCVPARLFQKTCSASCCAGAPLGQRQICLCHFLGVVVPSFSWRDATCLRAYAHINTGHRQLSVNLL